MHLSQKRARRYGIIGLGVVAILVLAVVLFPWNALRGPLESYASHRLHRTVTIGHLSVSPGWVTRVQLDDVAIANAAWSDVQPMATTRSAIFTFHIGSLLKGSPDTVRLVQPNLMIEKNANGDANWVFDRNDSAAGPVIGAVDVEEGLVRYRDPTLRADLRGTLQTGRSGPDSRQTLEFSGRGTLRDEPLEINGHSEGFSALRKTTEPYHLTLTARAGKTQVAFDGTIVPASPQDLEGALHVRGPDLALLYPLVPAALPWTPPYDLKGTLSHANSAWNFRDITGTVGSSDLAGNVTIDMSSKRALTTANLTSRKLKYTDLGGFVGLRPNGTPRTATAAEQQQAPLRPSDATRVLSNKRFDLAKLRDHDVDLQFTGESVRWQDMPVDHLKTHLTLKSGVMRFDPLDFGIADGHVVSNIALDLTRDVPAAEAKIEARNVELKRIFPSLASPNGTAGRFGGRAQFRTRGNSVAELFAAANGEGAVAMRGGEASTLRLVLANLDLARAATLLLGGDESAPIRCAIAAVRAKDGSMTPEFMVVDTEAVLITGDGSVDFAAEKYDLHLKADSKKPSILALKGPIVIGGTFKTPVVRPEVAPVAARIGASIGLGMVSPPLALLPLIDPGDAPDADCSNLYRDAKVRTDNGARAAAASKAGSNESRPARKAQNGSKSAQKRAPERVADSPNGARQRDY